MLALFGNLSLGETVVIVVVAVLIFGRRLPEVAVQAVRGFHRLRRSLDDFRRESGVDVELREMRRSLHELEREARVVEPLRLPGEPRRERAPTYPSERAPMNPSERAPSIPSGPVPSAPAPVELATEPRAGEPAASESSSASASEPPRAETP